MQLGGQAKTFLFVISLLLSLIVNARDSRELEHTLPVAFHGVWVTSDWSNECPPISSPKDAMSSGEGILYLRSNEYISQETDCELRILSKHCCDREYEDTRSGTLICGRYRTPIILFLQKSAGKEELIVATYDTGMSGPSVKSF